MQDSMTLPPGLEFLRTPFMSTAGSPMDTNSEESTARKEAASDSDMPVKQVASESGKGKYSEAAEEVRQVLSSDLDAKVAERLESVFLQGEVEAHQYLVESRRRNEELSRQVAEFKEREAALEMDNAALHQILATVIAQLANWGSGGLQGLPLDVAALSRTSSVPDSCQDGASTSASERGAVCGGAQGEIGVESSPEGTLRDSPLSALETAAAASKTVPAAASESGCSTSSPPGLCCHRAPASESGGSSSEGQPWDSASASVEPPPGLEFRNSSSKLPDVPPFPFPSKPQAEKPPAKALSLADALGLDEDAPMQEAAHLQALVASTAAISSTMTAAAPVFTPGAPFSADYSSEVYPAFSYDFAAAAETEPADGFIFNITLRKAEGCSFGLLTSCAENQYTLNIDGVLPGGAAEAWNRQCGSSGAAEKVLLPGDTIVSVNGISGSAEDMKKECDTQQLMKLMVVRSDGPRSLPPTHVAAISERSSTLRAEASEFVPALSADATEFVPMGLDACLEQYDGLGLPVC